MIAELDIVSLAIIDSLYKAVSAAVLKECIRQNAVIEDFLISGAFRNELTQVYSYVDNAGWRLT